LPIQSRIGNGSGNRDDGYAEVHPATPEPLTIELVSDPL